MECKISLKNYIQFFKGNTPFGTQAKLMFHIDRLYDYLFKKDCKPIFMEISLTNLCNMKCEWCINSNFRANESLNFNSLAKFLKEFKNFGGKAITFSGGGEPTVYKRFEDTINVASYIGLELALMTNGDYPKKYNKVIGENLKWVRFSVDTVDKKKYKKWKGIEHLDKIIKNVEALRNYPVKVGINCNVHKKHTVKDIKDLINTFINKVSYIQFRPILPRYYKSEKSYLNKKVWFYLKKLRNPKINISNDKLKDMENEDFFQFEKCDGHFFEPILNANGDICVCMYHPKDDRFVFGNIYKHSFKTIWNSKKRREVIEFVRNLNYKEKCQVCCKLAEANKFLDFINHPQQGGDKNFL